MPSITEALGAEGALIDLLIGLGAASIQLLRAAGRPIPSPVPARGVLDTGAEMTCVDRALIQSLALPWSGAALASLPAHGGVTIAAQYEISLEVLHPSGSARDNLTERDFRILEIDLAYLGYQVLIGRDLLARCRFMYDGKARRFDLEY